jgi:hypothetical protein
MKTALALLAVLLAAAPARATLREEQPLDAGFAQMYELKFSEARRIFHDYIDEHPREPMGQAALAASYLFEIFNEEGVFTSSFFLNDKTLLGGVTRPANPARQAAFLAANGRARQMAQARLDTDARDPDGLFVLTLANGMEADYDALIAKRQLASLSLLHQTKKTANVLLVVNPQADDAYLALGAANYIIGCLPGYKRFFLRLGGIRGDRETGMRQLSRAANHGHYLQPFAKAMLALAALREKQPDLARKLFRELHAEFPENDVFARELAKLDPK